MVRLAVGSCAHTSAVPLPHRRTLQIYAAQILLGIEHMHARGLLYRDLKPENMLVKEDGSLLIADFGMSIKLKGSQRAHSICGTVSPSSPSLPSRPPATITTLLIPATHVVPQPP